jgi:hypothetical protein
MSLALAGYPFRGPIPRLRCVLPRVAGVYAVLRRHMTNAPLRAHTPFGLLLVGETDYLSSLRDPGAHPHYRRWVTHAGSEGSLHLAVHYMPRASLADRRVVASHVIATWSPDCPRVQPTAPHPNPEAVA